MVYTNDSGERLIDGFGDPFDDGLRKCSSWFCGRWFEKDGGYVSPSDFVHCSELCYRDFSMRIGSDKEYVELCKSINGAFRTRSRFVRIRHFFAKLYKGILR